MKLFAGIKLILLISICVIVTESCRKKGCTDRQALNFDKTAGENNGSCIYRQVSDTPAIKFNAISKTFVNANTDSVKLTFSFVDNDGDWGATGYSDTSTYGYVTDHRSGKQDYTYAYFWTTVNVIGSATEGPITINHLQSHPDSGLITIALPGVQCAGGKLMDTVTYSIQVKDRAGHKSNVIEFPQVAVKCN